MKEYLNCNLYPISFHYSSTTYLIPSRAAESHILNFTESPLRASLTAAEVYFVVSWYRTCWFKIWKSRNSIQSLNLQCSPFLCNIDIFGFGIRKCHFWCGCKNSVIWRVLVHRKCAQVNFKITNVQRSGVNLNSSKKRMFLGWFHVVKIIPAFISWETWGHHKLLLRFSDL